MKNIIKRAKNIKSAKDVLYNMGLYVELGITNIYDGNSLGVVHNTDRMHPILKKNEIIGWLIENTYPLSVTIEIDKNLYIVD